MTLINRIHSHIRTSLLNRPLPFLSEKIIPTGKCKEYPRMLNIVLPKAKNYVTPLHEAIKKRESCSFCITHRKFTLGEMGTLLGESLGIRENIYRNYPSGGALYPVETYLIGNIIEGYPSGVFHYNPTTHILEFLWEIPSSFIMSNIVPSHDTSLSSQIIVFTSVWNRSSYKYGDLAYSHSLIEAGHMAQNILLVATSLSIGTRCIAGYNDKIISELLDINEKEEQPIYSILLFPPLKK